MLNKSHRSVVSTCVLIFMPYFKKTKKQKQKKTIKNSFKKKKMFFFCKKKHDLKKTVFFFTSLLKIHSFASIYNNLIQLFTSL